MAKVKLSECPNCLSRLDRATCITGHKAKPRPGSWTVCYRCGALLHFDRQMQLLRVNDDEREDLRKTHPDVMDKFDRWSAFFRENARKGYKALVFDRDELRELLKPGNPLKQVPWWR